MNQPAFSPQNIPPLFSEQDVALFTRHRQESLAEGYKKWFDSLPDEIKESKKIQERDIVFLYGAVVKISTEKRDKSFLVNQKDVTEYNKHFSPTRTDVEGFLIKNGFEIAEPALEKTNSWRLSTRVLRPGTFTTEAQKPEIHSRKGATILGGVNPPSHPPGKGGKMAAAGEKEEE